MAKKIIGIDNSIDTTGDYVDKSDIDGVNNAFDHLRQGISGGGNMNENLLTKVIIGFIIYKVVFKDMFRNL